MKNSFTVLLISRRLYLGLLLFTLVGERMRAQDSFTRILSGAVVSGIDSTILAWGDFNNDGFQDLFVSTRRGPSLLYSNNGNGTFSQIVAAPVGTDSGLCIGATWGDYDNDGFLDLFVGVGNFGNDWLYHNNGHGGFTKVTTGAIVSSGGNANNTSWADYDNDGFIDLFVANSDQNDFLYHNNRDGTFTRIMTNAIALKTGNSQGGSWADYDSDGLPDLFVSRINEPNLLYHNEGHGVFTSVTNGIIVHDVSVGQGTSWGDYDNDGHLDLFVANPNNRNFLYHNNGDGTFDKITNGAIVTDIATGGGCGWADYDNDGYLDLFVANRRGTNSLYHNHGDGTFTRVITGIVPTDAADAISGAWADYDNDGFPDLFVTELTSINNRLYRNNGNSNNWLTIQCSGRISNRAAIGAKVRVKAAIDGKTVWQLREISGGGGLGAQNDLRASFGLGDATMVDVVRVEWPSDIVQELHDVAPRQFLTVIEPSASVSPPIQQVAAGDTAIFTLSTTFPPPLRCQWRLNDVPIPGETNFTLVIANAQATNAGTYAATIINPETGFAFTTPSAVLIGPVNITQQPLSENIQPGSNVIFRVRATGAGPLSYQWRLNDVALDSATNDTFAITNVQIPQEGAYDVTVSNSYYGVVRSSDAVLIVLTKPVITNQPAPQTVLQGGTALFTVLAEPERPLLPINYRWLRQGVNFLSNAPPTLVITNVQPNLAGSFRVTITNLAGNINSTTVALTVLPDADADGLPDAWETNYFGNATNAIATADSDGDGMINLDEYIAGTNPMDALSVLKIVLVTTNAGLLEFVAQTNIAYAVQFRTNLEAASWNNITNIAAQSLVRTVQVSVPSPPPETRRFYRLVTPPVP